MARKKKEDLFTPYVLHLLQAVWFLEKGDNADFETFDEYIARLKTGPDALVKENIEVITNIGDAGYHWYVNGQAEKNVGE